MSQFQSLNPPLTTPDIPGVVEPYFGLGTGIWDLYRSFTIKFQYFPYRKISKSNLRILSSRKQNFWSKVTFCVEIEILRRIKFRSKLRFWVENEIFYQKRLCAKDLTLRFLKRILWNIYDKLDANFCKNLKSDKSSFSNNCENDKKCTIVP